MENFEKKELNLIQGAIGCYIRETTKNIDAWKNADYKTMQGMFASEEFFKDFKNEKVKELERLITELEQLNEKIDNIMY